MRCFIAGLLLMVCVILPTASFAQGSSTDPTGGTAMTPTLTPDLPPPSAITISNHLVRLPWTTLWLDARVSLWYRMSIAQAWSRPAAQPSNVQWATLRQRRSR